jgi:hypothetical protein
MGLTGLSSSSAIGSLTTGQVSIASLVGLGQSATVGLGTVFTQFYADVDTGTNRTYNGISTGTNRSYSNVATGTNKTYTDVST